ncbi:MAG: hypothetical protein HFJ50_10080 [Clostridia bacterium]|jgi:hypothetical protein|nr:hypothetical protein [Clostridia bacterium]
MNPEMIEKLYDLLDEIPVTMTNRAQVNHIKELLDNSDFEAAVTALKTLKYGLAIEEELPMESPINEEENSEEETESAYPKALMDEELEETYIGLLLTDPKSISRYYFLYDDCYFANDIILNLYKLILFSDGEAYASELAKKGYNFARNVEEIFPLKETFKIKVEGKKYDFEKIYVELRKLFILRKNYRRIPIKYIQEKIIDIINYKLYNQMSIEEVENAVSQAEVTSKFKQSVLNEGVSSFLTSNDNNLANGLELPFPILSSVFKGIRKGETTSFAMPSNAGKSRFTMNLASYISFVHHQKVLVISNEMSEEKMKLCLITTVINNPEIQKLHGYKLKISEGELLELKFRPTQGVDVETDENGYIARKSDETQTDFIEKLKKYSKDFCDVLFVTDWLSSQLSNSIHFINITDHTNEELNKVIKNYYYKEQIQYVFYDTLKADTEHIGNADEIKKTATILSNLAQNFNIFIGSTMQLTENSTMPLNLNVNDLSASRTVKEVLDTLCLIKQIHIDSLQNYEYSHNEVDTEFFDLEKFEDPNVRYYACVVDKNRAGAKPRVLFRLNLAYNSWEELGYLRLKEG